MWAHRLTLEEPTTGHVSHLPLEGAIPPREGSSHTQGLERLSGKQAVSPRPRSPARPQLVWTTLPWIPSASM